MNRQDGQPSLSHPEPPPHGAAVSPVTPYPDEQHDPVAVDRAAADESAGAWAIDAADGDEGTHGEDDDQTLTLVDEDDGPALENAFVGDVADEAAEVDAPIEFDEANSYPRLVVDRPTDTVSEDPEEQAEPARSFVVLDPAAGEALASELPADEMPTLRLLAADVPQAVEGTVALDDLRTTYIDEAPNEAPDAAAVSESRSTLGRHDGDTLATSGADAAAVPPAGSVQTAGEGDSIIPVPAAAESREGEVAAQPPPDDLPASYQSHFLDDADEEPEFVAHVDLPGHEPGEAAIADGGVVPSPATLGMRLVPTADAEPGDVPAQSRAVRGPASHTSAPAEPAADADADTGTDVRLTHHDDEAQVGSGEAAEAGGPVDEDEPFGGAAGEVAAAPAKPAARRRGGKRKSGHTGDAGGQGKRPAVADEHAVAGEDDAPAGYAEVDGSDEEAAADASAASSAAGPDVADAADTEAEAVEASFDAEGLASDDVDDDDELLVAGPTGGGWTIPLLCLGIAVIACCLIIPQADANRRLAYERQALRRDLESVQAQVATNDEFLRKLAGDPTLAERLAQRQMKLMRPNTKLLPVGQGDAGTSPFDLVQVTPPAPMDPYEPIGGRIATLCYIPRTRLYLTGGGLFLVAAGLVLGLGGRRDGV